MPPNDLRLIKARALDRAFSLFYEDFTKYLATTISLTESIPDQINNQIRNAFTHLARVNMSTDPEEIKQETEKAIGHIERANLDCLKVGIIHQHDKLDYLIADVRFFHGFLTPSIKSKRQQIEKERNELYESESRGDGDVTDKYEILLTKYIDLDDEINDAYIDVQGGKKRFFRLIQRWFRPIGFVIFTVVGVAVGFILRGYLMESYEWFTANLSSPL